MIADHRFKFHVDIAVGDSVVPGAGRRLLKAFLEGQDQPRVFAYPPESIVSEKVETMLTGLPNNIHRLKDIYDVVALAREGTVVDSDLATKALAATYTRRERDIDLAQMEELLGYAASSYWRAEWNKMLNDKRATGKVELDHALREFDEFVRPLLVAALEAD